MDPVIPRRLRPAIPQLPHPAAPLGVTLLPAGLTGPRCRRSFPPPSPMDGAAWGTDGGQRAAGPPGRPAGARHHVRRDHRHDRSEFRVRIPLVQMDSIKRGPQCTDSKSIVAFTVLIFPLPTMHLKHIHSFARQTTISFRDILPNALSEPICNPIPQRHSGESATPNHPLRCIRGGCEAIPYPPPPVTVPSLWSAGVVELAELDGPQAVIRLRPDTCHSGKGGGAGTPTTGFGPFGSTSR